MLEMIGRYYRYHRIGFSTEQISIGEPLVKLCNIDSEALNKIFQNYDKRSDKTTVKNIENALSWFYRELLQMFDDLTASFIYSDVCDRCIFLLEITMNVHSARLSEIYEAGHEDNMTLIDPIDPMWYNSVGMLLDSVIVRTIQTLDDIKDFTKYALINTDLNQDNACGVISYSKFVKCQNIEIKIIEKQSTLTKVYHIFNLSSIFIFEVSNLLEFEKRINSCDHCNKYFIPVNKKDEKYCSGMSPIYPNLTCKDAAKYINQQKKLLNSESDRLRRIVYNTLRNRLYSKKAKDDCTYKEYENELQKFSSNASEWRKKVTSGIASENDYINWLKSFQKRN